MDVASRVKELTRPTGEEDLLDVRYPKPRLQISLKHGAWVALAAVVLVAIYLLTVARPSSSPTVYDPPASLAPVAGSGTAGSDVVVSVVGAVEHPQLVTLAPDARVADALAQARPLIDADLVAINQAQKITDGSQINVPKLGETPLMASGSVPNAPGKISLNSADAVALEQLPGVGAKTAEAIVAHRESIGGFSSIEQLQDVKGIGPAKFEKMKDMAVL